MIHWFEHLPIGWMSLVVFAVIYLVTWGVYWLVMALAVGERARAFTAISPGMLPPLGIIFGLLVAFMAAQVWGDLDRAHAAVNREASALRAVVLVSQSGVNWVKWTGLLLQAICTLIAIDMSIVTTERVPRWRGLFATGVAVSVVLIASHHRPFTGKIAVRPDVLLQVLPEEPTP